MAKSKFVDYLGLSIFKSKIIDFIIKHEYHHPSYTPKQSGIYKITVDDTGHISSATPVTKQDIIDADIFPEYDFTIDEDGELTYSIKDS